MPDFNKHVEFTEVDRVIDGAETKTLAVTGVVAHLSSGSLDFTDSNIFLDNPVPVLGLGDLVVGYATISLQGQSLVAEVFLRYDSEERLLVENGESLYPHINGQMHLDGKASFEGALNLHSPKCPVANLYVDSLFLSRSPPTNTAIPALGKASL
ncbi:hypothetical protein EBZ39_11410 [bacterium]|nr:hypothetical protein [bacterium]